MIRIFEEVGGRPFEVEYVPEEALRAQRDGTDDPLQKSFAALMLSYALGNPIEMGATLETFPLRPTSVKDYALRVVGH